MIRGSVAANTVDGNSRLSLDETRLRPCARSWGSDSNHKDRGLNGTR